MAERRLRILALHGGYQNGKVFDAMRTKDLQRRLRSVAEFVCLDGPILATASPKDPLAERRSWFNWDAEDPCRFEDYIYRSEPFTWHGLEDTFAYLDKFIEEHGPFDGILGFSQGAECASVYLDQYLRQEERHEAASSARESSAAPSCEPRSTSSETSPSRAQRPRFRHGIRFLILVGAFLHPRPANFPKYCADAAARISGIPSLHVFGEGDEYVNPSRSQELAGMYEAAQVYCHSKGHIVPQSGEDCKVYKAFLERFLPRAHAQATGPKR